jgi:hypothetical protein
MDLLVVDIAKIIFILFSVIKGKFGPSTIQLSELNEVALNKNAPGCKLEGNVLCNYML